MAKYPEYPIPQYPYETMQVWRNMVSQIDNGREQRRRKSTFPTYDVTLMYNALETADIDTLWNFYQDMEGTFHEFYFFTPIDESHKGLFVAVGDGVKDTYDLPGIVAGTTTVYVDGLPTAVTLLTGGGDEGADRCWFGQVLASGTIARNTLKISAADGVAFVDPSSDAVASAAFLAAANNHDVIKITSKTDGKKMHGYAKAAGTGETYGAQLLVNGDFEDGATGWILNSNANASVVPDGAGGNWLKLTQKDLTTFAQIFQSKTGDTGYLLRGNIGRVSASHNIALVFYITGQYPEKIIPSGESTDISLYVNAWATPVTLIIHISTRSYFTTAHVDSVSLHRVLTPSATGVTITSTPDGDTQDWASIEAGFDFYDAQGYDWEIIRHGSIPVAGAVISCDLFGQQRIRCRFAEDNLSRELFMARIYRTGIKLKGLKG